MGSLTPLPPYPITQFSYLHADKRLRLNGLVGSMLFSPEVTSAAASGAMGPAVKEAAEAQTEG